jgi:cell division inhibitor SulA
MAAELVVAWLEYLGEIEETDLKHPAKAGEAIATVFKAVVGAIDETSTKVASA